jgi:hypothetical protein
MADHKLVHSYEFIPPVDEPAFFKTVGELALSTHRLLSGVQATESAELLFDPAPIPRTIIPALPHAHDVTPTFSARREGESDLWKVETYLARPYSSPTDITMNRLTYILDGQLTDGIGRIYNVLTGVRVSCYTSQV